jgi:hypothetical protein
VIPQVVSVRVRPRQGRGFRIWVPLLPFLLILSPLLVLAVLVGAVALLARRINPVRVFGAGWHLFSAMRGTLIDITEGDTTVFVRIS